MESRVTGLLKLNISQKRTNKLNHRYRSVTWTLTHRELKQSWRLSVQMLLFCCPPTIICYSVVPWNLKYWHACNKNRSWCTSSALSIGLSCLLPPLFSLAISIACSHVSLPWCSPCLSSLTLSIGLVSLISPFSSLALSIGLSCLVSPMSQGAIQTSFQPSKLSDPGKKSPIEKMGANLC